MIFREIQTYGKDKNQEEANRGQPTIFFLQGIWYYADANKVYKFIYIFNMKLASTLFLAVAAQRVKDSSEKRKNDKERKLDEHKENKTFDDDFWWIPNNGALCTKKMKDWFSMTGQGRVLFYGFQEIQLN